MKARTTVAWWCRATAKTSPSQRLTLSKNLMIRLDFVSWTGYIFQHCGLRGESSFCVLTVIKPSTLLLLYNAKSSLVWCATDFPCYPSSRPPTWAGSSLPLLCWGHLQVLFWTNSVFGVKQGRENSEPKGTLHRPDLVLSLKRLRVSIFTCWIHYFNVK